MLRILAVAVVAMAPLPAAAQTPGGDASIERCKTATEPNELRDCVDSLLKTIDSMERLYELSMEQLGECAKEGTFDAMRKCLEPLAAAPAITTSSPPPPVAPLPPRPDWIVREETSRMDGSATVFMALPADEEIASTYGRRTRPILHLRCRERVTNVFISADWFLGDEVPVLYRLDKDKPVQTTWRASTDSKAAGLWNGGQAVPFLKSLLGRETLLIRVTPYRDGAREMSFTLGKLSMSIEPLRKACAW